LYRHRTGEAMKIELYVPAAIPTSSANAKSESTLSPNMSSARTGIRVEIDV
jgi:hypothetical protein